MLWYQQRNDNMKTNTKQTTIYLDARLHHALRIIIPQNTLKHYMVKTCPIAKLFLCCETVGMFLRSYKRKKTGKWHEYFSVVENMR